MLPLSSLARDRDSSRQQRLRHAGGIAVLRPGSSSGTTSARASTANQFPINERPEEAIRVFVRIRPPIIAAETLGTAISQVGSDQVRLRYDKHDVSCRYTRTFGQEASQEELFDAVKPLLSDALNGINCAIFAYGQTSAGKTHTMLGPDGGNDMVAADPTLLGILPRAVDFIFSELNRLVMEQGVRMQVKVSYMQIYNEVIHDLLRDRVMLTENGSNPHERFEAGLLPGLKLREYVDPSGEGKHEIFVSGLSEFRAESSTDVLRMLLVGSANRSTRATDGNASSSRSHAILQLTLELESQREAGQTVINRCKLSFVDLAGSEKMTSMGSNEGDAGHLRELTSINKSLSALGNVIAALARQKGHIPYRDSKLTRLLQDSLGGNTRTLLIACVAPTLQHASETFNTLQFADRAASVMVRVKPNVVIDDKALLCRAQVEIARLKRLLRYVMSGSGHDKASAQSEAGGATVVEAMAAGAAVSGAVGVQEEEAVAAESEMIRLLDENEKLRNENMELKRKLAKFQARLNLQHSPVHRPGVWSPVKKPLPQSNGLSFHARKSVHQSPGRIPTKPFSSLDNSPYAVARSMTSVPVKREPSPRRPRISTSQSPPESVVGAAMISKSTDLQIGPGMEKNGEHAVSFPPDSRNISLRIDEPAEPPAAADDGEDSPLRGKVRRRRKDRSDRDASPSAKPKSPEGAVGADMEGSIPTKLSIDTFTEPQHPQQSALSAYLPRGMRLGGGLVARLTTPILRNRASMVKSGAKSKKKRKVRPPPESSDSETIGHPRNDPDASGSPSPRHTVGKSVTESSPSKHDALAVDSRFIDTSIGYSIEGIVDKLAGMSDRGERAKILGECIDWASEESEMRAIENELSKHSQAIEAELAEEERALKEIESEKLKLLRLLEAQRLKDHQQSVVTVSRSCVTEPVTYQEDSQCSQPTRNAPADADTEAAATARDMIRSPPPQIIDAIPSTPLQASLCESNPSSSKILKSPVRSPQESGGDSSAARKGTVTTVTSQRHNPARLSYSFVDIGRGIEMYSLVFDCWSDVEILGYNEESGMHLCIVRDGAAEKEQWMDLKKKPIRAKQS